MAIIGTAAASGRSRLLPGRYFNVSLTNGKIKLNYKFRALVGLALYRDSAVHGIACIDYQPAGVGKLNPYKDSCYRKECLCLNVPFMGSGRFFLLNISRNIASAKKSVSTCHIRSHF